MKDISKEEAFVVCKEFLRARNIKTKNEWKKVIVSEDDQILMDSLFGTALEEYLVVVEQILENENRRDFLVELMGQDHLVDALVVIVEHHERLNK